MHASIPAKKPAWTVAALDPRAKHGVVVIAIAILLVIGALFQPYRESPIRPSLWTLDWWLWPIERNAFFRDGPRRPTPMSGTPGSDSLVLLGEKGHVAITADDGNTWNVTRVSSNLELWGIAFANLVVGYVVGSRGEILRTRDQGATWNRIEIKNGSSPTLRAVSVKEVEESVAEGTNRTIRVIAVGSGGTVIHIPWDSARPPTKISIPTTVDLYAVHQLDQKRVWLAGEGGTIVATVDGGKIWKVQHTDTKAQLRSIAFADARRGFAVSPNAILKTVDGGETWRTISLTDRGGRTETSTGASAVYFRANLGWMSTENGQILLTDDGGEIWFPYYWKAGLPLWNIAFAADAQRGWAIGGNWTILRTDNGGKSWRRIDTQHRAYPAPWLFVLLLPLCGYLALVIYRSKSGADQQITDTISDHLATDRPLRTGDFDAFQFGQIARGLSRFLRNESTDPPLTIAVTGEWGTGKSSIMNLLQEDLRAHRCRCIWFNAWHHQKEEHLLASLIDAVRRNAIPRPWSFDGVRVRGRLLWKRMSRKPARSLLLIAIFLFCGGFLFSAPSETLQSFLRSIGSLFGVSEGVAATTTADKLKIGSSILGLVVTAFTILRNARNSLAKIGLDPAKLMVAASDRIDAGSLKNSLSYRHQFAAEFRDATEVLLPARLIVIIDDIDRCKPENVTDVLEAVNFLTSSGDCFLVVGMARAQVELCVGLSFKEVAGEIGSVDVAASAEDKDRIAKERRREYARRYIEKLINLEVPVPIANVAKLLTPTNSGAAPSSSGLIARLRRFELRHYAGLLLVPLFASILYLGWYAGDEFGKQPTQKTRAVGPSVGSILVPRQPGAPGGDTRSDAARPADPRSAPFAGPVTPPRSADQSAPPKAATTMAAASLPSGDSRSRIGALVVAAFVGLVGLMWFIDRRRRIDLVVRDSKDFVDALSIWSQLIGHSHKTPRGIKRFMNRLRYFAMRLRPDLQTEPADPATKGFWQRFFGHSSPPAKLPTLPISEASLVALAAVEEMSPLRKEDGPALTDLFGKAGPAQENSPAHDDAAAKEFSKALTAHLKRFGMKPSAAEIQEFRGLELTARVY